MSLRVSDDDYVEYLVRTGKVGAGYSRNYRPPQNKYRNKIVIIDGLRFQSIAEANRFAELKLLADYGQITDLVRQVPFEIELNGQHICIWYADFSYLRDGACVIEDVKGCKTPVYRLKKRLVEAQYSCTITEIPVRRNDTRAP